MIPVRGVEGKTVGVLGLGRSGLTAAKALAAGGAQVRVWDDNTDARARAEAQGFTPADLTRESEMTALDLLITSPGIRISTQRPTP